MLSKDHYYQLEERIKEIKEKDIKKPTMPIDSYTNEANSLSNIAKEDKDQLISAGLDPVYIDNLEVRAGALRFAETKWRTTYKEYSDKKNLWVERSIEAKYIRKKILHYLRFIAYDDASLKSKINLVVDGKGNDDLVQDLSDLYLLATNNEERLLKVGYNKDTTEQCGALSDELSDILARINGNENSETILMRNRAYTYLKVAVDEVRRYGKFVFWEDENRRSEYASDYKRELGDN